MIVDSSALIAILAKEPESRRFIELIVDADRAAIAAPSVVETSIALRRFEPALLVDFQRFIAEARLSVVAFGPEHVAAAEEAYRHFGRASGHRAKLNFGDCISYAVATIANEPLLFKGDDLIHTDITPADGMISGEAAIAPKIDPTIEARAREWLTRCQTGEIDWSQCHEDLSLERPAGRAFEHARSRAKALAPLGEPTELKLISSQTNARGFRTYHFHVAFATTRLGYVFGLSPDGKINKLGFNALPDEPNPWEELA